MAVRALCMELAGLVGLHPIRVGWQRHCCLVVELRPVLVLALACPVTNSVGSFWDSSVTDGENPELFRGSHRAGDNLSTIYEL